MLLDLLDHVVTGSEREKEFGSERKCVGVMVSVWNRARRALPTRFCMRFGAKRVVVDDVPHGMVDIDAPFSVAVAEQQ